MVFYKQCYIYLMYTIFVRRVVINLSMMQLGNAFMFANKKYKF